MKLPGIIVSIFAVAATVASAVTIQSADRLKIDFSGTVTGELFYDSPLVNIGDAVTGSIEFDYYFGANPAAGSFISPKGTTTLSKGGITGGDSSSTHYTFEGTGPSETSLGLVYNLDGMI